MNLQALAAQLKALDVSYQPAISDAERDYFRHYNIDFEEHYDNVAHHFGHLVCERFNIVTHYFEHKQADKTCFILPGYFDHSGLFGHVINYCLQRKLSVVVLDWPGHGLSTGEQASIQDFTQYQTVLKTVLSYFSEHVAHPWYVIAQSTGAAVLMDFLLTERDDTFAKAVLLAPLFKPRGWAVGSILHSLVAPFIQKRKREFTENSNDEQFTHFLEHHDPLQSEYLSLAWVGALKKWIKHFVQLEPLNFSPLIIQGKEDETVDWQKNMPVIQQKFPSAKVLFLQNGRHHLANESVEIRDKMFAAMDMYFDLHVSDLC